MSLLRRLSLFGCAPLTHGYRACSRSWQSWSWSLDNSLECFPAHAHEPLSSRRRVALGGPPSDLRAVRAGQPRMSPRSRECARLALKGFSAAELEPRTSDGELVADLLASAGAPTIFFLPLVLSRTPAGELVAGLLASAGAPTTFSLPLILSRTPAGELVVDLLASAGAPTIFLSTLDTVAHV